MGFNYLQVDGLGIHSVLLQLYLMWAGFTLPALDPGLASGLGWVLLSLHRPQVIPSLWPQLSATTR